MTKAFIEHVSEKPWSDYTEADYSIQQWHNACLVHQHTGAPTSKSQCKLPVKTPNGALNRNGVHAAAAALAGARSPLKASPEQKASAAAALRRYYSQLNEEPPPSLKHSDVLAFIEHHGVKGMKWGVRRTRERAAARRAAGKARVTEDYSRTAGLRGKPTHHLTNEQLRIVNERMNLEQNYKRLNPSTVKKGQLAAAGILSTAGMAFTVYNMLNSPLGKHLVTAGKGWLRRPGYSKQLSLF